MLNLEKICDLPSETDISAIEHQVQLALPPEYRNFLLVQNGGLPLDRSSFEFRPRGSKSFDGSAVQAFFCVGQHQYYSLTDCIRTYKTKTSPRVPDPYFPVACDPGGNLILISTNGSNKGSVHFWDHDRERDEGDPQPWLKNIYPISKSWDLFLEGLTQPEKVWLDPFDEAAGKGRIDEFKHLVLQTGNPNFQIDVNRRTPMSVATRNRNQELIEWLYDLGASIADADRIINLNINSGFGKLGFDQLRLFVDELKKRLPRCLEKSET